MKKWFSKKMIGLAKWALSKATKQDKVVIAYELLVEILESKDYAINNTMAEKILETVVKSSGNRVIDFIVKD